MHNMTQIICPENSFVYRDNERRFCSLGWERNPEFRDLNIASLVIGSFCFLIILKTLHNSNKNMFAVTAPIATGITAGLTLLFGKLFYEAEKNIPSDLLMPALGGCAPEAENYNACIDDQCRTGTKLLMPYIFVGIALAVLPATPKGLVQLLNFCEHLNTASLSQRDKISSFVKSLYKRKNAATAYSGLSGSDLEEHRVEMENLRNPNNDDEYQSEVERFRVEYDNDSLEEKSDNSGDSFFERYKHHKGVHLIQDQGYKPLQESVHQSRLFTHG